MSDKTSKDGQAPQTPKVNHPEPEATPKAQVDEKKLRDEGWSDVEIEKLKLGWSREPISHHDRHTKQYKVIGYKMVKPYVEEYWKVRFDTKAHEMETDIIKLGKNDNVLRLKRGEEIIVPRSYLQVADDGKTTIYKQDDDGTPREAYQRQEARYQMISKGHTKAEYDEFLRQAGKEAKKEKTA